uniref:DUF1308 domain-containing protein n=1 Tax=Caenorhabditis tropicalis TaxID=1561998 RepID=A0A1I7TF66_9PELO
MSNTEEQPAVDIEQKRVEKIAEVRATIAQLSGPKFKNLENSARMLKMLKKEIALLEDATTKALETHLVTCNYAFYKSLIDEIDAIGGADAVLKLFKRDNISVTVDIVKKEPNVWIKIVNRPAKTVLIEYRDGKRNGDILAQVKQHLHVSRRFNNPEIQVHFKKGVLHEMAEKLTRHGIVVFGDRVEKEDPTLIGKWNDELIERLAPEEDSDWDNEKETPRSLPPAVPAPLVPTLNLDISAVMLLVTNMCEPEGVKFQFKEDMINKHVKCERVKRAKPELLRKMEGHNLIMSTMAYNRVAGIVGTVGGPNEKQRFTELSKQIKLIKDQDTNLVGRVAKMANSGASNVSKYVFSCAEMTNTTTVTANQRFLLNAKSRNVYFKVIEIQPRPLTEQKEAVADPM